MQKHSLLLALLLAVVALTPAMAVGPVTGLVCTPVLGTTDVDATWTNDGLYGGIEFYVDGVLVATLGPASTSFRAVGLSTGPHTIRVSPFDITGATVADTSCTLSLASGLAPTGLAVTLITGGTGAELTWTNAVLYTALRIFVNGAMHTVLPGSETSFTLPTLGPSPTHHFVVRGYLAGSLLGGVGMTITRPTFIRGDCNDDTLMNIADPILVLAHMFSGSPIPCEDACDANDDGSINIADGVYLLHAIFGGGPLPPAPYAAPGVDPTSDALGC